MVGDAKPGMVEMKIYGLALDDKSQSPVIVLKDEARDVALPIWIGPVEAMAISLAVNAVDTPRPMTHDLLLALVDGLSAKVVAVEVVALREGTFYAEIVLDASGRERRVDCRPSDAIALAVRAKAPIRVAEQVLSAAGTHTLESAKTAFGGTDADKWAEELENLSADESKYKM